jgi:putative DNA primase/helicase
MKQPLAERVARTLIDQLERGTAPLIKPWQAGIRFIPYNPISGRTYRGINALSLMMAEHSDPRWLTYKQGASLGAQVRRGEKGTLVQYWKFREERAVLDETGAPMRDAHGKPVKITTELERPRVFSAVVFNADQVDGLPPPAPRLPPPEWQRHAIAEQILAGLGVTLRHMPGDRAFYTPRTDTITLPERAQFSGADAYYVVALHEAGHASGSEGRLNRDLSHPFGSPGYAREELRAEIASLILGEHLGIGYDPGQHTAYVGHWITILREDPAEIFRAASDAEQIARFLGRLAPALREELGREAETPAKPASETPPSQERAGERIYLSVPYEEKQAAKRHGARWDKDAKSWYIPEGTPLALFEPWKRHGDRPRARFASDPRREFADALRQAGLLVDGPPDMDGRLRRVRVDGDRRGAKSGAYVGFLDGYPAGYIENFKTGLRQDWKASAIEASLTDRDRERLFRQSAERRAIREDRAKAVHTETIGLLIPFLDRLAPAGDDHPYLLAKGVGAYGIGIVRDGPLRLLAGEATPQIWGTPGSLIVPMHTIDGELIGVQSIAPDGFKCFPRGCRWGGGMHLMTGRVPTRGALGTIVIAEGYATAATIHERTGLAVAAAFTAGNLEAVARACRDRHPGAEIYIAGDNDHQKERELGADGRRKKNVGREAAIRAAEASGGMIVLPPFAEHERGSDWNDLAQLKSPEDWLRIWQAGIDAAKLEIGALRDRTTDGHSETQPLSVKSTGAVRRR